MKKFAACLTETIQNTNGLQQKTVSSSSVSRYESGERIPKGLVIGALLRIAEPEQQRLLLEALGIEDVEQFAADLLASAGVTLVA